MTAWIVAIGRMLGLGSIAGIRPSLVLAVIGVVSHVDWGQPTNSTFSFLGNWVVIGVFVVLAILESTFDKIAKLDRLQDRLIMPYRLVAGAVAGAATAPFGWQGIVVGAALGAGSSWAAQYTKHLTRPRTVPSDAVVALLSAAEDLGAFVGGVLFLAVPYTGYAAVVITGAVFWRVRDRRRSKYRKMRRDADRRSAAAGARRLAWTSGEDYAEPDEPGGHPPPPGLDEYVRKRGQAAAAEPPATAGGADGGA